MAGESSFSEQASAAANTLSTIYSRLKAKIAELPASSKTPTGLASNEQLSNDQHARQYGSPTFIKLGRIIYAIPYLHAYRVVLDDHGGDILCCAATQTAALPFSPSVCHCYAPGTKVAVMRYDAVHFGIILGAVADSVEKRKLHFPDWIEQGSNGGFQKSQYYYGLLNKCVDSAGLVDWSSGRPLDSLAAGEWTMLNDLGMGVHLDNFMAFMRMDETCGLWLYYFDRLARLAAYNFSLETAGSELIARNDQGEFFCSQGFTPYPWEALGLSDPKGDAHQEHSDKEVQIDKPVAKYEAKEDQQQPFYRYEEFTGYPGQAFMAQLSLPPKSAPSIYKYDDDTKFIGVYRYSVGLDGSVGLETAHSAHFVKRMLIPIPKRKKLAEDQKDGDGSEGNDYKFAGIKDLSGDEHKIKGQIKANDTLPNVMTALGAHELAAHLFNWKALHPFYYHKQDYYLPEESEMGISDYIQKPPTFSDLQTQQYLDTADAKQLHVDHRYEDVDYYPTTCGLHLLPDGSVVIRDGYGSEIRMTAGSISSSAPGDIWQQAGRSNINWAGDDHIVKAQNSIDITSSQKDVRLKAKQNFEMVAGTGGAGRFLIENKATSVQHNYKGKVGEDIKEGSGIILKAAHSQVAAIASNIYLRTGSSDGDVDGGTIVIDADKGQADVCIVCSSCNRTVSTVCRDTFMQGDEPTSANEFGPYSTLLDTSLRINGGLVSASGGAVVSGSLLVVGGSFAVEDVSGKDPVPKLKNKPLRQAKDAVSSTSRELNKAKQRGKTAYKEQVDAKFYKNGQIGNGTVQKQLQFSFRNEKQYNTEEFKLPETYWQHLANATGGEDAGKAWNEESIKYQDDELMPYPGKKAWEDENYLRMDDKLVDQGRDADRADNTDYEDPEFSEWQKKALKENYKTLAPQEE